MDLTCNARFAANQMRSVALGQLAISDLGSRMFIGEPQEYKADDRHENVNWENQSDVSRRKIVRDNHLVNVTASCAQ